MTSSRTAIRLEHRLAGQEGSERSRSQSRAPVTSAGVPSRISGRRSQMPRWRCDYRPGDRDLVRGLRTATRSVNGLVDAVPCGRPVALIAGTTHGSRGTYGHDTSARAPKPWHVGLLVPVTIGTMCVTAAMASSMDEPEDTADNEKERCREASINCHNYEDQVRECFAAENW